MTSQLNIPFLLTDSATENLIKSKFYFAGGCYFVKTDTVIEYLQKSIAAVTDIMP